MTEFLKLLWRELELKELLCILCIFLFCSCAQEPKSLSLDQSRAYVGSTLVQSFPDEKKLTIDSDDKELFAKFAPVFVVEDDHEGYNKIGEPKIRRIAQKQLEAYVDPSSAKVYVQKRCFFTERGHYTNLIYRVHFEKIPFKTRPFHVGAGKNVGLLVVVTLNEKEEPVLVVTVHTCGCYISVIPTNYTPKGAFPTDWKPVPKYRYGEKHTPLLCYPMPMKEEYHPTVYLRTETHRVSDVFIRDVNQIDKQFDIVKMELIPMAQLEQLPVKGESEDASLYYSGLNKGFVRNALKPFEFLFMSWWAFDMNVGVDKKYASSEELRMRFYTSLNPAYRAESDMWNYGRFLKFWGWNL